MNQHPGKKTPRLVSIRPWRFLSSAAPDTGATLRSWRPAGFLNDRGGKWDNGKWGVYESDESDGTFLNHKADIKIVTNIDNDHLDYYKSEENLHEAFAKFIHNKKSSFSIVYLGDKGIQSSISLLEDQKNVIGYIETSQINFAKENFPEIQLEPFEIFDNELSFYKNGSLKKIKLPFAGDHYLKNAFAAMLAAEKVGVDLNKILEIQVMPMWIQIAVRSA